MTVRPAKREAAVQRFHPELRFGGFTEIDGMISFYARVQELLSPDAVALDVGCGRGAQVDDPVRIRRELRTMRGRCARVIGIDVDPRAASNPTLDEFRPIEGGRWPVDDAAVDLLLADFVLEHITDPSRFFAEAARVLRPGGHICLRTVNVHSYLGVASRLVPDRAHERVLGALQPERPSEDVFETVYRCNTRKVLRGHLRPDFDAVVYTAEAEPNYLAFNVIAYGLGMAHRRLAPPAIRPGLLAWGRRR
jgi:SAM-dependent methyltransferase